MDERLASATEILRRLLDERGVEYFKHEDGEPLRKLEKADEPATSWHMGGASVCAVPIEGSDLFDLWIDHCTPEQAIAATLGSGTCRNEWAELGKFRCSECWLQVDAISTNTTQPMPIRYCPNCGRRVKR